MSQKNRRRAKSYDHVQAPSLTTFGDPPADVNIINLCLCIHWAADKCLHWSILKASASSGIDDIATNRLSLSCVLSIFAGVATVKNQTAREYLCSCLFLAFCGPKEFSFCFFILCFFSIFNCI